MSRRIGLRIILLFVSITVVFSCYEPVNDCLDILATNYEVSSDEACDDCCTYPKLSIQLEHTIADTLDFDEDSIYLTKFNEEYQIKNLQYFINDFKLLNENLEYQGVEEFISFSSFDGDKVQLEDNVIYVTPDEDDYEIGTFIKPGNYSKIRFLVGLNATINHGDLESLDSDHILITAKDSMYINQEQGYYFNKLNLVLDTSNTNATKDIYINEDSNLVVVEIDHEFTAGMGDNISFTIKADYSKWFNNQELGVLEVEEIKTNIVNLTASAFSIVE